MKCRVKLLWNRRNVNSIMSIISLFLLKLQNNTTISILYNQFHFSELYSSFITQLGVGGQNWPNDGLITNYLTSSGVITHNQAIILILLHCLVECWIQVKGFVFIVVVVGWCWYWMMRGLCIEHKYLQYHHICSGYNW